MNGWVRYGAREKECLAEGVYFIVTVQVSECKVNLTFEPIKITLIFYGLFLYKYIVSTVNIDYMTYNEQITSISAPKSFHLCKKRVFLTFTILNK